eukprot:TRINITY_DN1319_c7_g1_i2.p1 TRINITY_DN1319_c7_g1~~TRINITY_DN1319_c7_g1_i2.p1  ORF type:complete len:315 (+),score=48.49 TRINITY_DN1319_c7_g1_i2:41-946(+)
MTSQRVALKVTYLSSSSHTAVGCGIHFFQVTPRAQAGEDPAKKLVILVDRPMYLSDVDTAMNRCIAISKVEAFVLYTEDLRPVASPSNQYDLLLRTGSMLDFLRLIGSVFKPGDPYNEVPAFELEPGHSLGLKVNVRLVSLPAEDVAGNYQSDALTSRIKEQGEREVAKLRNELEQHKADSLEELVDLHTKNEQLRHTLNQTENLLSDEKRYSLQRADDIRAQAPLFSSPGPESPVGGLPVEHLQSPLSNRSPEVRGYSSTNMRSPGAVYPGGMRRSLSPRARSPIKRAVSPPHTKPGWRV